MAQLTLRDVTKEDFEWLYELTKTSYIEVVERQFGKWVDREEKEKVHSKWANGSGKIILKGSEQVGAFLVEDWKEYDLLREILIRPEFQNMGIGSRYINHVIEKARLKNKSLRLRVLFGNSKAKKLYDRLGFLPIQKLENQHLLEVI